MAEGVSAGWEAQRQAEIEAGRQRFQERSGQQKGEVDTARLTRDADEQQKEDEKRREAIYNPEIVNKREHDFAGSTLVDASQTMLEAYMHAADRVKKITTVADMRALEAFKFEGAKPEDAEKEAELQVTVMAEGQPTVLANERGEETEGRPRNASRDFTDEELALGRLGMPSDIATPKTKRQARKRAGENIPPARQVLKEAAIVSDLSMEPNEAVEIVKGMDDEVIQYGEDGDAGRVVTPDEPRLIKKAE
jgi:hypothetical protein